MLTPLPADFERGTARIVYSHASALVGGGNVVLLRLFSALGATRYRPYSLIPEPGPLEQYLTTQRVPYGIVDLRPASHLRQIRSTGQLLARLISQRPTLIHANDPGTYRQLSQFVPRGRRVCHVHHPDFTAADLSWCLARPPAAVLVPTQFVAERVHECLGPSLDFPVHVVWNPIDTDWFTPASHKAALRGRLGLRPSDRHISMVASLSTHKGHETFLRMAHRIVAAVPDVTFSIVGGTTTAKADYVRKLESLAASLGIRDRVRFWGFVEDATARDIIASSDLFVLPSKEEGFGMVLAEAQACGVPVLTSALRPLPEVVPDGQAGYLLDPDDHAAFADRALSILQDSEKAAAMASFGRAFVEERFAVPMYMRRVTAVYESLTRVSRRRLSASSPRTSAVEADGGIAAV